MKLKLDPADEAFRAEVRAFLHDTLPNEVRRRSQIGMHPPHDDDRRWWNRILNDKGWAAPHWPTEYGGPGWSHLQAHLFEYECRIAGAPELRWQGLRLIGPVLYKFGTEEQKARFLPGILSGQTMWAQGFSEPGAGSDLALLRTSAVLDGDHYVINGQKIWTTEANYSDWGFFLVRTDNTVKPQRGISMIVLDLKSPGVTVRGIPTINGECSTWEVFLDNVRVPKDQLIGTPGSGWDQGKFLLGNERTASADIEKSWSDLRRIRRIAAQQRRNGRPVLDDPLFAARLNEAELMVQALEWSVLRVLCNAPSEHPVAARASVLKVRGSELQQRLNELMVQALGAHSLRVYRSEEAFSPDGADPLWPDHVPGVTVDLLYQRALTIYGGAREVQKNIIAKLAFDF
ncbi:acyl-CoA dehydrogenase domain protein [Burkholderia sp. H160]|nr:acyl-CoA dehydrogenase domain protein [Burkholderia sp. H160]